MREFTTTAASSCASHRLTGLDRGENFFIVEINGIGGEAVDARDPLLPLGEIYRRCVDRQQIMFLIGDEEPRADLSPWVRECPEVFGQRTRSAAGVSPGDPGFGLTAARSG